MQQPVYKNSNTSSTEQTYRTNIILWAAMLMSQLMFLVLIYFARPELFKFSFGEGAGTGGVNPNTLFSIDTIVGILAVLGLVIFAVSFVLKARFLRLGIANKSVQTVQTGQIVAYALCEAVSLLGMLSAFAFNFRYFFAFFALGILGFLLHFPRRDSFQAAAFTGINLKED